jgi:DNA-directed RNA polymerase specialized sigma24 family protein|tara:strand:+ start:1934 stop:2323 length:390 start_codon:yes stop_codon:yes gene_type:complete
MPNKRKEYPVEIIDQEYWGSPMFQSRPENALEVLMKEPPPGIPLKRWTLIPLDQTDILREVLADAIEALDPEDRWLIERVLIEGVSLRKVGAVLGISKTSVARRRDRIRIKLIKKLLKEPQVIAWTQRN